MARGYFYTPPPTFVGGRQPYAPPLGIAQSGQADVPPPVSRTTQDIIYRAWKPSRSPPSLGAVEVAAAPDQPPPISRQWFDVVLQAHRDDTYTLIYVASIAPILATPPTIDNPPQRSHATLFSIVDRWQPVPHRPPPLKGVGQFSVAVVPDAAPRISYANLNQIRMQWEPRKWWPLPENIDRVPPNGVIADVPPPTNSINLRMIVDSWRRQVARVQAPPGLNIGSLAPDVTPDQFTFIDMTGVGRNALTYSNTVTLTGFNTTIAVSVSGGEYSKNAGTYTSTAGTAESGDTITVDVLSSSAYATPASVTFTAGGISDTFTATTGTAPQEVIPYLIGEEEYSARQMLESIYMVVSVIGSGGTVTAQSVAAFSLADRGTTVEITMGGTIYVPPSGSRGGNLPYNLH